jgi:magnesium chelatase family protein
MSVSIIQSRAISGLSALPVQVETDLANGLPSFSIVGLPDAAVREAKDRVRAAIHNSGFEFPQRRVTVNLAPADLPKESGRFDLPIAIGILVASGQIAKRAQKELLKRWEFVGELSLTGNLLPVHGAFALAMGVLSDDSETENERSLVLPLANRTEASLTESTQLGFAASLRDVTDFLQDGVVLPGVQASVSSIAEFETAENDWSEIYGQEKAKRAALIAAAGQHNLLMFGPPGVGKSMIAARLPALLPGLSRQEACELASIKSLCAGVDANTWRRPPFRSPHHSTPARALVGGGAPIHPGEISLAHHGVLFLDELPEFSRDCLESLREPLETGEVSISRVRGKMNFPANFMLVAAMNPCPCGYYGAQKSKRVCRCPPDRIERYRSKISGPVLDRFDMAIQLESVSFENMTDQSKPAPMNAALRNQVESARTLQLQRQSCSNGRCSAIVLESVLNARKEAVQLLEQVAKRFGWSLRSWHRALRVARTIADLENSETVELIHVSEAIELRRALDLPA